MIFCNQTDEYKIVEPTTFEHIIVEHTTLEHMTVEPMMKILIQTTYNIKRKITFKQKINYNQSLANRNIKKSDPKIIPHIKRKIN